MPAFRVLMRGTVVLVAAVSFLTHAQEASAQKVPVTQGTSPLISQYDPNAITALQTGFNAVSGGLGPNQTITRFRFNTSITASGFNQNPLTVVTQFGQGGQGGLLGTGGNNGFGGGGGYQTYGQGASGVAGGAAAGIGLFDTANLYRQPAGVQINSLYSNLIGLPMGQNNFLSSNQRAPQQAIGVPPGLNKPGFGIGNGGYGF